MKIKSLTWLCLVLLCALNISARQTQRDADPKMRHHLMPVPAAVRFQTGRLTVTKSFAVAVSGHTDARLLAGIDRTLRRLEGRTGFELARGLFSDATAARLLVKCQGSGNAVASVDENEAYTLEVSDKQAVLSAPTVVGALHGMETFLQLLESDQSGYYIPSAVIQDKPRFPWRGLLIDAGRHFQPVDVIKRNLDGMAAVKLNVLHWHLTEDQGFRIESRQYPKLHLMGSDGLFYTQDQVRDVIAYAWMRGIRVVPEFDMPGHATSWLVGHPELGSAPGPYTIERQPGIMEPALDPTREEVYTFLDGFLGEMAAIFPDAYLHIGGDENEGKQWNGNPKIQAFMREKGIKNNQALQAYFNQRLSQILKKHGKRMMGWDEILQPDLPKDVVVQSWRGAASLAEAAKKGYNGILSSGYYIDLMYPASQHYMADPLAASDTLSDKEVAHILGGEATMWSEYVSPETIDSRIWPRTAAIAERLWSPRSVVDVNDMYRRLDIISVQLEELGLTHERNSRMLLRRMVQSKDIAHLETLVSVIEPVKEYHRGQQHLTTMLSPLTSLVDAARPDSEAARVFAKMVDELLSDAPRFQNEKENITHVLTRWHDVHPALTVMFDKNPILREAAPLVQNLSDISAAGLEAVSYLSAGTAPPAEWRASKLALMDSAAKPHAALEFPIIQSVRQLIVAAAELPNLKATTPAEWRERVKTIASEKKKPPSN